MGSYHRITIAILLIVCVVGLTAEESRGDGTYTRPLIEPRTSPNISTTPPTRSVTTEFETEYFTSIGTTIIIDGSNKELSPSTPTRQSQTILTSAPDSTNGTIATTQNVTPTVGSSKASPAALVSHSVTTVHTYTEDIGTGTGVGNGTGGEILMTTSLGESTTNEVDLTSDGAEAPRGDGIKRPPIIEPQTSQNISPTPPTRPVTTEYQTEDFTSIGTTIITVESNKEFSPSTPTQQSQTILTSAPDSTNGTIATTQNVTPTVGSSKASPAALVSHSVTTVHTYTEDIGIGTGVGNGTGGEIMMTTALGESTTNEVPVDLTSDGAEAPRGDGTILVIEPPTSPTRPVTEYQSTTEELPATTQDTDILPSTTEHTDITTLPIAEITRALGVLTSALATALGEQSTDQFASTSETLTTSDHITPAQLTTPERATTALLHTSLRHTSLPPTTPDKVTTSMLHTSLPPTTPERATTALLHTSLPPTTPDKVTTSMLHTSLPPTTPERATTALLHTSLPPTTPKIANTSLLHTSLPPSTPERATTALLHTSRQPTTTRRASSGGPSTTHVAQTTDDKSHGIDHYRISASELSQDEIENIVTLQFSGISEDAWVSQYDIPFRGFLSTTLTSDTIIVEPCHIFYIIPTPHEYKNTLYVSVIPRYSSRKRSAMPVVPLNETLGALSNLTALTGALGIPISQAPNITTDLPDFILPTLPNITTDTSQEPSTTRKPPPTVGFLSNPGLFISLVVIATVSIIIIIVGLIYLLCDRRRGRSGEYITNHTPRNSDLELGFDNPVMAENDKNVSNGNHLSSIKGEMESDMIVPYDNFTQEELMNYEVEDTHL